MQALAPAPSPEALSEVCADACQKATSHEDTCECRCGGANHGRPHRAGIQAAKVAVQRRTVGGFTPGMLTDMDKIDEEW